MRIIFFTILLCQMLFLGSSEGMEGVNKEDDGLSIVSHKLPPNDPLRSPPDSSIDGLSDPESTTRSPSLHHATAPFSRPATTPPETEGASASSDKQRQAKTPPPFTLLSDVSQNQDVVSKTTLASPLVGRAPLLSAFPFSGNTGSPVVPGDEKKWKAAKTSYERWELNCKWPD